MPYMPICLSSRVSSLVQHTDEPILQFYLTYNWAWSKINFLVVAQDSFLAADKRPKLAWFRHVTRHNSLSKFIHKSILDGVATPWSVEEMWNGQNQRVDVRAHARAAHKGLLQKRLEEDLC